MKRIAVIVGIVLSIAVAIGAFVIVGGNESSEAKSSETTSKVAKSTEKKEAEKSTKDFALVVAGAARSASGGPVPKSDDKKDDDKDDDRDDDDRDDDGDDDDDNGYEARKRFVGVSPSRAQAGKTIEVQVRGVTPNATVVVIATPKAGGASITLASVPTNSKGRGKIKVLAPAIGEYKVSIQGSAKPTTTLKVVKKK